MISTRVDTAKIVSVRIFFAKLNAFIDLVTCSDHLFHMTCFSFCLQDTPGFIVNRLLVPYIMEAIRMLERGVNQKMVLIINCSVSVLYIKGSYFHGKT